MKIAPARRISGNIRLQGDKSISHRAALIAAIADGATRVTNYSDGNDCSSTLECLSALGVAYEREGADVIIQGVGQTGLTKPIQPLDCGNSGTTMRLLAGILAGQPFGSVLTGDASLRTRPMQRITEPIQMMGALVEADDGHAPLHIAGCRPLTAITYEPRVASAQVKSCVLFAGLFADGLTTVTERSTTRDHTERLLTWFGANVLTSGSSISISGQAPIFARDVRVPGDISAAAYFMTAAACLEGSDLLLTDVGMNPTRSAIVDILRAVGANVEVTGLSDVCNEPVADVRIRGGLAHQAGPLIIAGRQTAGLIDELPVLAVLGSQLNGGIEVRDAAELRVKESDRILAVVDNLKRIGASVKALDDGFRVDRSALHGATLDSFGDHRIAMSMAIAGLLAEGDTEIDGAECVEVSFPGFFERLGSVVS